MRRRSLVSEEESGIDLTPMLDVVFILLIFFIVTTSFVKESGIDVNRPKASTSSSKPKANIMIAINQNGSVWIDKREVDVRAVRANVERLRAINPEGGVIIQADEASNTGTLVKVMDQIRLAGVEDISISAKE
jgi:biopolymer transport protein ExbD